MIKKEKEKKVKYSSLRGMADIIPSQINLWHYIEKKAKNIFEIYNFKEIRTPLLEYADLFLRSIGEDTDIVEKEMYIFQDKKGRTVALRPEGTASVVRAYIQNSLFNEPAPNRLYYIGPMFRYERPQKGRFRQFHQIGAEVFGVSAPSIDAELIFMLKTFFEELNIIDLNFEINSLGCKNCRPAYKEALYKYLSDKVKKLCDDCKRRFNKNPLRVLDCKVKSCKEELEDTPSVLEFLCDECNKHFHLLQKELLDLNVCFKINQRLVRGLDYYNKTVFEITTHHEGAQNAVAAGGRYDDLVASFGGPDTPAAGFAIGVERLIEICSTKINVEENKPDVYVSYMGVEAEKEAKILTKTLRDNRLKVERTYQESSLKSQLRKADRLGVKWVVIIGEDEVKKGLYRWKNMKKGTQGEANLTELIKLFREAE